MRKTLMLLSTLFIFFTIGCSDSELNEKEESKILADVSVATTKLYSLTYNSFQDITTEDLENILPNYYAEPLISQLRSEWYEKIVQKDFNEKDVEGTFMEILSFAENEKPQFSVVNNKKVKLHWGEFVRGVESEQVSKLEIIVKKNEGGNWKISSLSFD
ncbi:hypothetical protein [Siminovitchia fordii]|uniref:DUF3828 domain-containing protein n=1 Tax=Siminovitchia fordii TaxID=254759 RepID=A0ABQ4K3U0_9BACI|nr:hypothetical protein [Siminovitchia fordii]GIN19803.1 hypothetical protein J1TS3_09370 [Siminovitchia fordii]